MRRLVSVAVPFSTAATELFNATESLLLSGRVMLLSAGLGSWLGSSEGVGVTLELVSVVDAGDGVM